MFYWLCMYSSFVSNCQFVRILIQVECANMVYVEFIFFGVIIMVVILFCVFCVTKRIGNRYQSNSNCTVSSSTSNSRGIKRHMLIGSSHAMIKAKSGLCNIDTTNLLIYKRHKISIGINVSQSESINVMENSNLWLFYPFMLCQHALKEKALKYSRYTEWIYRGTHSSHWIKPWTFNLHNYLFTWHIHYRTNQNVLFAAPVVVTTTTIPVPPPAGTYPAQTGYPMPQPQPG